MANQHALALMLRDGLFLKDAKGWTTSALGRASTLGWPFPSTIRGALRTAWGLEKESAGGKLWSPDQWLTQTEPLRLTAMLPLRRCHMSDAWRPEHRMWAAPRDAYVIKGGDVPHPLTPQPRSPKLGSLGSFGAQDDAMEALWHPMPPDEIGKEKPGSAPAWWTEAELVKWLCGEDIKFEEKIRDIPARDQTHVTIKAETGTAAESQLYGTRVIEPLDAQGNEWAMGVRVRWPAPLSSTPHKLKPMSAGGKRRLVYPETVDGLWEMPEALSAAFDKKPKGLRIVLATPAEFTGGWLPDGFVAQGAEHCGQLPGLKAALILRAACVPRPQHVSGWDMAARDGKGAPKPTRRLVPAGAVYFFERADGQPFTASDATALWCAQFGQHQEDGQGLIVPGVWPVKNV